ncbi:hypothetical protein Tco_0826182 [Tanacetum coccineum]
MLRRITTINRHPNHRLRRHLPYFSRQFTSTNHSTTPTNPPHAAPPPPPSSLPVLHRLRPSSLSPFNRSYKYALTATAISAAGILTACSAYVILQNDDVINDQNVDRSMDKSLIYEAVDRSKESVRRVLHTMKQTGVAAAVLWKSLSSVLRNYEVRLGFEVRVAALLADIVAANEDRRAAIVGAGGGVVVDWLLESVGMNGGGGGEAARALAYLIADENVCGMVLGRPNAVPNLLRCTLCSKRLCVGIGIASTVEDLSGAVYDKALENPEEVVDFDEDLIDLDALLDDDDVFMTI